MAKLAASFATWKQQAELQKQQARLLCGAAIRWANQKLSACWNTWREQALESKRQSMLIRRGLMRMMAQKLARAFAKWCDFIQGKLASEDMFQKSAKQWQQIGLSRGLRKWLATTTRAQAVEEPRADDSDLVAQLRAEIAELKKIIEGCGQSCQHRSYCPVCPQETDHDIGMMKALAAMRNLAVGRAYRTWRDSVLHLKHQTELALKAIQRWQRSMLLKAYNTLVEHAREMRMLQAALNRWNQMLLNSAWNTWLDFACQKNEKLRLLRKSAGRMLLGPLARCVDRWRDEAQRMRRIQMLLKRAAMRWSRSKLYMAFQFLADLCEALRLRELEFCAHLTTTYRTTKKPSRTLTDGSSPKSSPALTSTPGFFTGDGDMLSPGTPKTAANTLFVIGGQDGLGRSTSLVQKMSGSTGVWSAEGDYQGTSRQGHGVVVAHGLLYTIGGRGHPDPNSKNLERFNTMDILSTTDGVAVLKPGPPMNEKRNNLAVSYLKNKIYATGGGNGVTKATASVEVYDLSTGQWQNAPSMIHGRHGHSLVAVQGKLYVIGGVDAQGKDVSAVECFNTIDETWTEVCPLNLSRLNATATAHQGFVYVVGGTCRSEQGNVMVASVERYDPKKDRWIQVADLPSPRAFSASTACGGFIYVVGGHTPSADPKYPVVLDTVLRYDSSQNVWTEMPPLGMKRSHHCLAAARLAIERM